MFSRLCSAAYRIEKNTIVPSKPLNEKSELIALLKGCSSKHEKYLVKHSEQENKEAFNLRYVDKDKNKVCIGTNHNQQS